MSTKRQAMIEELERQIASLQDELTRLQQAEIDEASPFKVGDVIEWETRNTTAKGRVKRVRRWAGGDPYWIVDRIRSNGSIGCQHNVYPFRNPKLSAAASAADKR